VISPDIIDHRASPDQDLPERDVKKTWDVGPQLVTDITGFMPMQVAAPDISNFAPSFFLLLY
jgi:hypothetical protein